MSEPIEFLKTNIYPAIRNKRIGRVQGRLFIFCALSVIIVVGAVVLTPLWQSSQTPQMPLTHQPVDIVVPSTSNIPFNTSVGAVLPNDRIIAFYGIPGAPSTGPAYTVDDQMLAQLQQQGAAYQKLDPAHPVKLGIDLVVSVPDAAPGPSGNYSHHVDSQTIQTYIDFCQQHGLLLFLDLNYGQAPIAPETDFFLPYLEKYAFVHMAIDPEWMFPQRNGLPGQDLSRVSAADLNTVIEKVAPIAAKYHLPRKILIIHQYRGDGEDLKNPKDAWNVEIQDKHNIIQDKRVDVVFHIDSVGNYPKAIADKKKQYTEWVTNDIQRFHNFQYGGFKLFYHLEAPYGLMTPAQVLALKPAPMIVTYGN